MTVSTLSFLLLTVVATVAQPPDNPTAQYRALLREWSAASGSFRKATTDQQRNESVERQSKYAPKFLDLAEMHRDEPVALLALKQAIQTINSADSAAMNAWEMNESVFPTRSEDKALERALAMVLRDHLKSDKLGPICDRMRYGYRLEYESCLATILDKSPHKEVRAIACLSLAQFLNDHLRMLDLAADRPDLVKRYDTLFGKDFLRDLRQRGRAKLVKRIESLFERAKKFGGKVAEKAKSELYDLRHLAVGKTAPDIVGQDQDGTAFKLSDYRGMVVLLYFWVEF